MPVDSLRKQAREIRTLSRSSGASIATSGKVHASALFATYSIKLREISADAGAHSSKQRHHELNKSALHLSSAHIGDERFPVVPPFSNFVEHREEHDALHVDIGPTGSTSNVPELRNLDALAVAVQRVHH